MDEICRFMDATNMLWMKHMLMDEKCYFYGRNSRTYGIPAIVPDFGYEIFVFQKNVLQNNSY